MRQERSRPDFDPPAGDAKHGRWTADTPTSRQRLKTQKQEQFQERVQKQEQARKEIRTEPNAEEIAEAQRIHDAGLVRTAEQQQAYRKAGNLLAGSHPKTKTRDIPGRFGESKAGAIADRWARR